MCVFGVLLVWVFSGSILEAAGNMNFIMPISLFYFAVCVFGVLPLVWVFSGNILEALPPTVHAWLVAGSPVRAELAQSVLFVIIYSCECVHAPLGMSLMISALPL